MEWNHLAALVIGAPLVFAFGAMYFFLWLLARPEVPARSSQVTKTPEGEAKHVSPLLEKKAA